MLHLWVNLSLIVLVFMICLVMYGSAYSSHSRNNPIYAGSGGRRVLRGGSWDNVPVNARASNRYDDSPDYRFFYIGFRLVAEGSK